MFCLIKASHSMKWSVCANNTKEQELVLKIHIKDQMLAGTSPSHLQNYRIIGLQSFKQFFPLLFFQCLRICSNKYANVTLSLKCLYISCTFLSMCMTLLSLIHYGGTHTLCTIDTDTTVTNRQQQHQKPYPTKWNQLQR